MSIGAKQLGALVIAIIVAVSSVGITASALSGDGIVKSALEDQIEVLSGVNCENSSPEENPGGGGTPTDETPTGGGGGIYHIPGQFVVGGQLFGSLQEAVNAASDGDYIVMLKDATGDGLPIVPDGKEVTLNTNGHMLNIECSPADAEAYFNNPGLTFSGAGQVMVYSTDGTVYDLMRKIKC